MNDTSPLRIALIGAGAFGEFCAHAYAQLDEVRLAGVTDLRSDLADDFAKRFGVVSGTLDELVARDDVDLVHIATPPSSHYQLALQCLRNGKHVLCEKPLAVTDQQADEMLAEASKRGLICPVNFVLRYNRVSNAVRRVIDSGALGRVLSARLTNCASDSYLPPEHWFWDKSVSGGIFIEHGVHFFDLYRHWLGEGQVLAAHTETRQPHGQEDRVTCLVRHDDGTLVSHYHGFDQVRMLDRTSHHLVCELGDLRVEGWIPLSLTVEAAVDDRTQQALFDAVGDATMEILEEYEGDQTRLMGRGVQRTLARRVRLSWTPDADKQAVYARSTRELLADQARHVLDPSHVRAIDEANGKASLRLATAAARWAEA
jgi:predicted dehydrogenase